MNSRFGGDLLSCSSKRTSWQSLSFAASRFTPAGVSAGEATDYFGGSEGRPLLVQSDCTAASRRGATTSLVR